MKPAESQTPSPYQGNFQSRNEPNTALRMLEILAAKVTGDFDLDMLTQSIILAPEWIAEGRSQEDKHTRYIAATFKIVAAVTPYMMDKSLELNKVMMETDDGSVSLKQQFSKIRSEATACNIVAVSAGVGSPNMDKAADYCVTVSFSEKMEDGEQQFVALKSGKIEVREEDFTLAFKEAKENGYRRINCHAMTTFFSALELWYAVMAHVKDKHNIGALHIREQRPRDDDFGTVR